MFEYTGAIHIHSIFSDGSGRVEDIAAYASEAGLDFILLTDHNTLRALKEGYEGFYGKTLLLVGCEINDKENKNHLLAFGINETYSTRMAAKNYVRKVKESGGIGFIAHPHEKRGHMKEHPAYPWEEWDTEDFTGIEIWNHMSEWMENLTEQNKYQSFIHPLKTITAPQPETLKLWDELNQRRKVVGIGGVDAHAHKYNLLGFVEVEIFPYKVLFKSIRTHIITNEEIKTGRGSTNFSNAKRIVYNAMSSGSCFVANDYHADSKGFRFYAQSGKKTYGQGETVDSLEKLKLKVHLPDIKGEIRFIRNGRVVNMAENQMDAEFDVTKKGVYRVEVYLAGKAWIFTNHIRICV